MTGLGSLLLLGSLASTFAWKVGQELEYAYSGRSMAGIYDLDKKYSIIEIRGKLIVQVVDEETLSLQLTRVGAAIDPHYHGMPYEIGYDFHLEDNAQKLSMNLEHMESPFQIKHKNGLVQKLHVPDTDPVSVVNFKKAVVSSLQLHTSSNYDESPYMKEILYSSEKEANTAIDVLENSILGKCKTKVRINRLTGAEAMTNKYVEALRKHCARESPVYEISKQTDVDSCTHRPSFRISMPHFKNCKAGGASCDDMFQHAYGSRYFACKVTEGDLKIARIDHFDDFLVAPFGSKSSRFYGSTLVTFELNRSWTIRKPLPGIRNPVTHSSLAYVFPEAADRSGNIRQPGFEDAPASRPANILQVQDIIIGMLENVTAALDQEATESNFPNFDYSNKLLEIRHYLAMLTLTEVRDFAMKVETRGKQATYHLLIDILATIGTPATAKYVADVIRQGKLGNVPSTTSAADVAMLLFNHIDFPTRELLADLMDFVRSLESGQTNELVHITSLMGMAELLNHACASQEESEARFPADVYGKFCTTEDEVYTDFVAYVAELLQTANTSFDKMAYLTVAGSLGTEEIFPLLLPYIRGVTDQSAALRTRAIYSLQRYATRSPQKVTTLLDAIYENTAEDPDVRMVAASVLLQSTSNFSEWQRVAYRTWFEPNKQVASFIHSYINSFANLPDNDKRYAEMVKNARLTRRMVKSHDQPLVYSRAAYFGEWSSENELGFTLYLKMLMPGYQKDPVHTMMALKTFFGPHAIDFFQMYESGYGIDELRNRVRQAFSKPVKQSRPREINFALSDLDNLFKKLGVEKRPKEEINSFSHVILLGHMHRIFSADNLDKTLPKALKMINEAISKEGYSLKMQNFRSWTDVTLSIPCVMGVPATFESTMPSLMSVHANVKGQMSSLRDFDVTLDGNTVISSSFIGKLSITIPFTNSYVAAGFERRMDIRLPKSLRVSFKTKDWENIKTRITLSPSEEGKTLFHGKAYPFLLGGSILDYSPLYEKTGFKRILAETAQDLLDWKLFGILQLSVASDGPPKEEDEQKSPFTQAAHIFYPENLRYRELQLSYVPKPKPAQIKIGYEQTQSTKYPSGNFTYIESGTPQESPRPIATPVGQLDPEADTDIAGGYFSNRKVYMMTGETEVASLALNYAEDMENTFRKGSLIMKMSNTAHCVRFRQEIPYISKFNSAPCDTKSKTSLTFAEGQDCMELAAKGEIVMSVGEGKSKSQSPPFDECNKQTFMGILDSRACSEARRLADTYDRVSVKIDGYNRSFLLRMLVPPLTRMVRQQNHGKFTVNQVQDDGRLNVDAAFSPDGKKYSLISSHNGEETVYKNIHVHFTSVLPFRARKSMEDYYTEFSTDGAQYPSCYISKNHVETFDGVAYNYTIDACDHLLAADCSGTTKFAVVASRPENGNFTLRIITEADRFEFTSEYFVNVNKKKSIRLDSFNVATVSSGSVTAYVYKKRSGELLFVSNVVNIHVYFKGTTVTIRTSFEHTGRMCGLCGDMNYEESLEFFDPKRCALSSGSLMAASYRVNSDTCTSLPADVQTALNDHRKNCQSVDKIIRTALPITHENCHVKRSNDEDPTIVCDSDENNGNGTK